MATDIQALLGDEADSLLGHECKGVTKDELVLPGPDFIDRVFSETRTGRFRCFATSARCLLPREARWNRVPLDSPRRPRYRALCGRELRKEPRLLRPGEPVRAGNRG